MSENHHDLVTRSEFLEAIRRLDAADAELRSDTKELERVLRAEFEGKIADAIESVGDKVDTANENLKEDVTTIQNHLTWQDRMIVGGFVSIAIFVSVSLILHYAFHIG